MLELLALQGGFDEDRLFDGLDDLPCRKLPESASSGSSGIEVLLRVTVSLWRGQAPLQLAH